MLINVTNIYLILLFQDVQDGCNIASNQSLEFS